MYLVMYFMNLKGRTNSMKFKKISCMIVEIYLQLLQDKLVKKLKFSKSFKS
jgi:hypothetical protein